MLAIHVAAANADLESMEAELASGVGVGVVDEYGSTALHLAALQGHVGIVEALPVLAGQATGYRQRTLLLPLPGRAAASAASAAARARPGWQKALAGEGRRRSAHGAGGGGLRGSHRRQLSGQRATAAENPPNGAT